MIGLRQMATRLATPVVTVAAAVLRQTNWPAILERADADTLANADEITRLERERRHLEVVAYEGDQKATTRIAEINRLIANLDDHRTHLQRVSAEAAQHVLAENRAKAEVAERERLDHVRALCADWHAKAAEVDKATVAQREALIAFRDAGTALHVAVNHSELSNHFGMMRLLVPALVNDWLAGLGFDFKKLGFVSEDKRTLVSRLLDSDFVMSMASKKG